MLAHPYISRGRCQYLTRLSFSEFQELLGIVTRINLSAIDRRLTTLENMNLAWYHSLVRVLRQQYGVSHRYFSSADGLVQYVVSIISAPVNLQND